MLELVGITAILSSWVMSGNLCGMTTYSCLTLKVLFRNADVVREADENPVRLQLDKTIGIALIIDCKRIRITLKNNAAMKMNLLRVYSNGKPHYSFRSVLNRNRASKRNIPF